jgi:hypothetical protein
MQTLDTFGKTIQSKKQKGKNTSSLMNMTTRTYGESGFFAGASKFQSTLDTDNLNQKMLLESKYHVD